VEIPVIRRYNYTNRQEIKRADVRVEIFENPLRFDAAVSLSEYRLPKDAKVFIEAYRQTTWMRFDFGPVAAVQPSADRHLTDFETSEGLLFRVKVTASNGSAGRLLAVADQLPFVIGSDGEGKRQPLLPVKPQDLGAEIWRVDYSGARPILLVNRQLGDWRNLARSPMFVCLVYPQAMRDILSRVLYIEKHFDDDNEGDWRSEWLAFGSRLAGSGEPPVADAGGDAFDDWIEEAVAAFARAHGMSDRFRLHWVDGGAA
jgi:hypothetical protein